MPIEKKNFTEFSQSLAGKAKKSAEAKTIFALHKFELVDVDAALGVGSESTAKQVKVTMIS